MNEKSQLRDLSLFKISVVHEMRYVLAVTYAEAVQGFMEYTNDRYLGDVLTVELLTNSPMFCIRYLRA